jgi:hypothetical protein
MERAIGPLREEIGRETRQRSQERRTIEEEIPVLHERKMTIYEDAEAVPVVELRFPPGLEGGVSETDVSTISHSSEPTTETLAEEPDQVTESPGEGSPEKVVVAKLETHESPEVDSISREGPGTVKELDVIPEEPVVGPEPSQVSYEESAQEDMSFDEAQPSQEAAPILQDAPLVSEERAIDQAPAPLIPSDPLPSLEEASDTQSEHISSSQEFPRPHTPHPIFYDPRAPSHVPFPVTNDHEDQGYGTQEDEGRTAQVSQRAPGKHVHWGSVEAQPAYEWMQDGEDQAPEEHSPPLSRQLLPAPSVTESDQRVAQPTDELTLKSALLEQAEANAAAEEEKRAGRELRELQAKLDESLLLRDRALEQAEANMAEEKKRAGLKLHELQAKLDELLLSRDHALKQAEANAAAEEKKRAGLELHELQAKFDELLLSRDHALKQAEANAAKEKKRAGLELYELQAQLDDLLLSRDHAFERAEANAAEERERAGLELRELQAKLDESLLYCDHALEQAQSALQKASYVAEANQQSQRELTEMRAVLGAKMSESALALRLRLADMESGCAKSKAEADTYRTQTATGLVNTDGLLERVQALVAEMIQSAVERERLGMSQ